MRPAPMRQMYRLGASKSFSLADGHSTAHAAVTNTLERPEPPISKLLIFLARTVIINFLNPTLLTIAEGEL